MRRTVLALAAVAALGLAVAAAPAASASAPAENSEIRSMHARGLGGPPGAGSTTPITFHGGAVMTNSGGINAYVIWYGSWDNSTAVTPQSKGSALLTNLFSSIGGSPYFAINTTYTDASGAKVPNTVTLKGTATDFGYSLGKRLTDSNIKTIVSNAISSGKLVKDPNGVYFVLTAKDVSESSGFLTKYCGWHTHATISGSDIKYSFVGDPSAKLANCSAQSVGPNGSALAGADAMASVIAHELEEAATDPDLNAWYDGSGAENADKCAWTFGTTYTVNGANANMRLGTNDYLIQQNWNASSQACGLKL